MAILFIRQGISLHRIAHYVLLFIFYNGHIQKHIFWPVRKPRKSYSVQCSQDARSLCLSSPFFEANASGEKRGKAFLLETHFAVMASRISSILRPPATEYHYSLHYGAKSFV